MAAGHRPTTGHSGHNCWGQRGTPAPDHWLGEAAHGKLIQSLVAPCGRHRPLERKTEAIRPVEWTEWGLPTRGITFELARANTAVSLLGLREQTAICMVHSSLLAISIFALAHSTRTCFRMTEISSV